MNILLLSTEKNHSNKDEKTNGLGRNKSDNARQRRHVSKDLEMVHVGNKAKNQHDNNDNAKDAVFQNSNLLVMQLKNCAVPKEHSLDAKKVLGGFASLCEEIVNLLGDIANLLGQLLNLFTISFDFFAIFISLGKSTLKKLKAVLSSDLGSLGRHRDDGWPGSLGSLGPGSRALWLSLLGLGLCCLLGLPFLIPFVGSSPALCKSLLSHGSLLWGLLGLGLGHD